MAMTSNIYLITNKINDKKYIGQSINIEERWYRHRADYQRIQDKYLYRAMRKYDLENFKFEVLETEIPIDCIAEHEKFWIIKLNTKAPNGYNMTDGGEGSFGRVVSESTREKISKAKKGIAYDDEHKAKLSKIHKERMSDPEKRRHLSEKLKGVPKNSTKYKEYWMTLTKEERMKNVSLAIEARKKNIIMCDIEDVGKHIKEFESVRSAAKWIRENTSYEKAGHQNISKACKGKINYVYGYKWIYKQEGVTTIPNGSRAEDELLFEAQSISN